MVIPYYAMNEEEITLLEREIKKKDKSIRDRIRAKRILAISSKIEKPSLLSLKCPKCDRKLKTETYYIFMNMNI